MSINSPISPRVLFKTLVIWSSFALHLNFALKVDNAINHYLKRKRQRKERSDYKVVTANYKAIIHQPVKQKPWHCSDNRKKQGALSFTSSKPDRDEMERKMREREKSESGRGGIEDETFRAFSALNILRIGYRHATLSGPMLSLATMDLRRRAPTCLSSVTNFITMTWQLRRDFHKSAAAMVLL